MNKKYQSYYTKSDPILSYMVNVLNINQGDAIFEPCGGDGVFVDKILDLSIESNITIFELDPNAVEVLNDKYSENDKIKIKQTDTQPITGPIMRTTTARRAKSNEPK